MTWDPRKCGCHHLVFLLHPTIEPLASQYEIQLLDLVGTPRAGEELQSPGYQDAGGLGGRIRRSNYSCEMIFGKASIVKLVLWSIWSCGMHVI